MALSPARGRCSVLMSLLLVAAVVAAVAAPAVTATDMKWAPPRERHGAHSHKQAPSAQPSAAAPAVPPPTPGLYPPHGTAAAAAPGPTPPQGAEAPAPSPDRNDGAAAVPFAWSTVLLVAAAGVAAASMV